ncbi:MAG TPA: MFS transporter [Planctomycetaceae bacterium]|nr:MFS transporter [Planctomycetaceae bacterium]
MLGNHLSRLRHNMRVSTADATSFGVMVGVGETYLPAFALAVGLGEVTAGLVGSLPLLIGGILQAISPWILRKGVSEQVWVVGASILQGCAFIPLIIAAIHGQMTLVGLMICASLYWAGGLAGGPAWNSWIDKLIPKPIRAYYFAGRTRAAQIATCCGFLGAGAVLQLSRNGGWETHAFAILFAVAWLARACSVGMLALHRSPQAKPSQTTKPRLEQNPAHSSSVVAAVPRVVSARNLIIYLALVQGMVQVSGPFYTPYMLKHLHIGYLGFATLIATAFIAKIIALSRWGEVAKRQGAQRLLLLGGALIVPAPMLWIVSSNYFWLLGVQTLSGIGWAAYELGFFLMLFESVPIAGRVRLLTIYNLANTSAWCIGATVGGLLLHQMGTSSLGYYTLFAISTVGRGAALIFLLSCCGEAVQALQYSGRRLLRLPQPQKVPELLSAQPSTVLTSGRQDLAA